MARNRVTVYLVQRKRRLKGGAVGYYYLRWTVAGRERMESLGKCSEFTKAQSKARRAKQEEQVNAQGMPSKRGGMTLGQFQPFYREARARGDAPKSRKTSKRYAKLADGTLAEHTMVIRYLIQHFGESFRLDNLDALAAEGWHSALADGKLSEARKGQHERGKLSENTLRSKVRSAKAIFGWAKAYGIIEANPFADWTGAGLKGKPAPYVSLGTCRAVCAVAPVHYQAFFGLLRLAGLRMSEALCLPWAGSVVDASGAKQQVGIDWDRKRVRLVAEKTNAADRDSGAFRVVPIVPELMPLLLAAFEQAPDGAERVAHPLNKNNLDRIMARYCKAAGVEPWSMPHQALRKSREDDWKQDGIAEVTYCNWLGHGLEVSRKHYVSPTEMEFDKASGGAA